MRLSGKFAQLAAAIVLLSASASAQNVTITTGGTFSVNDLSGPFSAPGGTWTLSFQVASQPVVSGVTANQFTTTYTNGVFTLNGTPITLTGSSVTFVNGGGFNILLSPTVELLDNSEEPNFFTGTTSSPTMAPGTYPIYVVFVYAYPSQNPFWVGDEINGSVVISGAAPTPTPTPTPTPPPTPAPASVTLVAIGLVLLAMLCRKNLAS